MKTANLLFLFLLLVTSKLSAQYCMLAGRTPYSTIQPGISNFKLNTINRTSLPVENMAAVIIESGDTTILQRGQSYTVTITHTRDSLLFPTVRNNIRVWIDYNHNMNLTDTGETVISADHQTYGIFSASFTVPANAALGTTLLRATAKMSDEGGHILPTACDTPMDPFGYHGEMEDYYVTIVAAPAVINETSTKQMNVSVFPNPAKDELSVSINNDNTPVTIDLFDISGRLCERLATEETRSAPLYYFNISQYPAGVYFIKVSSGGNNTTVKLVK